MQLKMGYREEMGRVVHDLKMASGWKPPGQEIDLNEPLMVSESVARLDGKPVKRKIFAPRSNGCRWAKYDESAMKGCSMCGFFIMTTGKRDIIRTENYLEQFRRFRRDLGTKGFVDYPVLCIFTGGSFLDDWELPWEVAQEIFRLLGQEEDLKKVVIESCAQYAQPEKLIRLRDLIGDKIVEVAVGLECSDEFIQHNVLNKDFSLTRYMRAVSVLSDYFDPISYVLIKPPFLTEREARDVALETGRYAFAAGCTAVSLEPMYVDRHTVLDFLFTEGYLYSDEHYRCPWLWTVFDIARTLRSEFPDREVRIGYSEERPIPHTISRNCEICTEEAYRHIEAYALTGDFQPIDELHCVCQERWQADMTNVGNPPELSKRLEQFLAAYDRRRN